MMRLSSDDFLAAVIFWSLHKILVIHNNGCIHLDATFSSGIKCFIFILLLDIENAIEMNQKHFVGPLFVRVIKLLDIFLLVTVGEVFILHLPRAPIQC